MYVKKGSEFLLNFSLEQIEKKYNEEKKEKASHTFLKLLLFQ